MGLLVGARGQPAWLENFLAGEHVVRFIHESPEWPQLVWRSEDLLGLLAGVRHRQGLLLGRMQSLGFDLGQEATLVMLTSEVVTSSAIEGEMLDAAEVRSSLASRLGLDVAGLPRPSREVEGVVEMMLDATQNVGSDLTAERLFAWHSGLFPNGRSGMSHIAVGEWRPPEAGPMQVVSGPIGRERVHFIAPAADRLPGEMQRFLAWFNGAAEGASEGAAEIDPVLKAGVAHFWFVTIHPFEDGNGRIARAIADAALARADGVSHRCYSMSAQIEAERKAYYRELERAQRGGLDITGWLTWFLGCLDRAVASSGETLSTVLHKAELWRRLGPMGVNDRQRRVINRMFDRFKGVLTTSQYAKLAKCSQDTALRDVRDLVKAGVLVQNPGGGRSTSYRLVGPAELAEAE